MLAQGSVPPSSRDQRYVAGAQKIMALGPDALAEACAAPELLMGPGATATVFNDPETVIRGVGSDGNRRLLSRQEWLTLHFATSSTPGPEGHGFPPEFVDGGRAYYVLDRGPVTFIVLDTVNPAGPASGSIGLAQYQWLEGELVARSGAYVDAAGQAVVTENEDRLIVIVSHHPVEAMTNQFSGPGSEQRFRGDEVEALLHRFPNVLLHIAGHTLEQRINSRPDPRGGERGYWQITTGSPLDAPMQGRLIDIVDNGDGTISVFSTVYDSAAPINPGDAKDPTPDDGTNERLLAGIARQLAANDAQLDLDAGGLTASDRNAEMLLNAPFDLATLPTPTTQARPPDI